MKDLNTLNKINILQIYYEQAIANNINGSDKFTDGIALGLKLALQNFGYDHDQLNNMKYVYNELKNLKGII